MRPVAVLILSCGLSPAFAQLAMTQIAGPAGSDDFGRHVHVLANGNIVVSDPTFDAPGLVDVGAVYLYSPTGTLISTLTGSQAGDQIGVGGSNGSSSLAWVPPHTNAVLFSSRATVCQPEIGRMGFSITTDFTNRPCVSGVSSSDCTEKCQVRPSGGR